MANLLSFLKKEYDQANRSVGNFVNQAKNNISTPRTNVGQRYNKQVQDNIVNAGKNVYNMAVSSPRNIYKWGNAAITAAPKQLQGLSYSTQALGHVLTGNQVEAKKDYARQQQIANELAGKNYMYQQLVNPATSAGVKFAQGDVRGGLTDTGRSLGNVGQLALDVATTAIPAKTGFAAEGLGKAVLRGSTQGAGFGALQGGIDTLRTGDYEHALQNIAMNTVSGAGLGVVLAGGGKALSNAMARNGGKIPVGFTVEDVSGKVSKPTLRAKGKVDVPTVKMSSGGNIYIKKGDGTVITNVPKSVQNDIYNASDLGVISPERRLKAEKFLNQHGLGMDVNGKVIPISESSLSQPTIGAKAGKPQLQVQSQPKTKQISLQPETTVPGAKSQISPKTPSLNTSIPQPQRKITNKVTNKLNGGDIAESKLNTRLAGNDKYTNLAIDTTHAVQGNKQTIQEASRVIRESSDEALRRALNPRDAVDVQINATLFNKANARGDYELARRLLDSVDATNMGQMVQILSNYDKSTPQGIARFAKNAIAKYNASVKNPAKKINLTNEMIDDFTNRAAAIQKMAEGEQRNIAAQQLVNDVNKLIPSTFADKAITVWKAGLLTSPRTTLRNIVGNTVHGATEIIKDLPAAANDIALSKITGLRTLTPTVKGIPQGAVKGLHTGKNMLKGIDPTEYISSFDVRRTNFGDSVMGKALQKYTDGVFNFMGAQDQPFYHSAFARSLYDQAGAAAKNAGKSGDKSFIRNLVDNPTVEMLDTATLDASTAVFKNPNKLRSVANKIKGSLGPAGDIIAPFTGVPSSIAGQMVEYSPVGLLKGIYKDASLIKNAKKFSQQEIMSLQRKASQEVGRGVIGTGLIGLGAYLTANGLMTGQPKDTAESRQWQLEGKQPNSVLVGGKWRSINSIGPEMLVVLAGSKLKGENALGNIGKDFLSQTFLQGVQGPLNAVTDPARYAEQYVTGQVQSIIPNVVKDVAKSLDPTARETKGDTAAQTAINSLIAGTPGLRNNLLPRRDAIGNPVPQEPTGLGSFVDIFNSKTPVSNSVVDELSRLNSVGLNATPSAPSKTQTVNGEKITLDQKTLDRFETRIGEIARPELTALVISPEYQSMIDDDRSKAIDRVMQKARAQAKIDVLGQKEKATSVKTTQKSAKAKTTKVKTSKAKTTSKISVATPSPKAPTAKTVSLKFKGLSTPKGGNSGVKKGIRTIKNRELYG